MCLSIAGGTFLTPKAGLQWQQGCGMQAEERLYEGGIPARGPQQYWAVDWIMIGT